MTDELTPAQLRQQAHATDEDLIAAELTAARVAEQWLEVRATGDQEAARDVSNTLDYALANVRRLANRRDRKLRLADKREAQEIRECLTEIEAPNTWTDAAIPTSDSIGTLGTWKDEA